MRERISDRRFVWILVGLVAGLGIGYFWPHEPAYAVATDRDAQFAMATCNVSLLDPIEGIFVLDFLTGSLKGVVLNRQAGRFYSLYYRDLAADFRVDPKADPHYTMVTGTATLPSQGGVQLASSVVYIGELSSGKIACYAFPWTDTNRPFPSPIEMRPIDVFQFREPSLK